ncbi:hypothetical protein EJ05DRAFT_270266 [Pseudovirgaria hyperparasitica]|uniref:Uncharacterized protein n=1 Tax=Pseudovirgaria hyperparasitica TaxID=470096 RepID=A0A6A6VR84_9PEZI|nr:uncharacterized protein EJ05DRAFT_270266 [Pseudovirgaria hyperparasitica]KAF2752655.1 hypothetical protein EJ05DRAFT_270266 [Pseudovirgaria hyperparasitica]
MACKAGFSPKSKSPVYVQESGNDLVVAGQNLAALTLSSLQELGLQRSFAYFTVFIFLSYCHVLRKKGFSHQEVDDLVKIVTPLRERDRNQLLDTIPWIHRLIVRLVRSGWALQRASELFFINALSTTDLFHIRSDGNFQSILEHFSKDIFVNYSYENCLSPSYTIPGLIASYLDWAKACRTIQYFGLRFARSTIIDRRNPYCLSVPKLCRTFGRCGCSTF